MDVDDLLLQHRSVDVSVDVDAALTATLARGRARRRRRIAGGAALALLAVVGVTAGVAISDRDSATEVASTPQPTRAVPSVPEEGDFASWSIDPAAPPSPDRDSFRALVTRLGCNSGRTGPVLRPGVVVHDDRIEVTFTVEHVDGGRCPGNLPEPYEVDLGVPLGNRRLVDSDCNKPHDLGDGSVGGQACADDGVHWMPPTATTIEQIVQTLGCENTEDFQPDTEPVPQRNLLCEIGDRDFGVAQYRDSTEVGAAFRSLEGSGYRVLGPNWIVSVNTPEAAFAAWSKLGGSVL
jgi:hypothetical protein